ncbi:hypothetical protein DMN91_005119 [Ooceraea biroi]|uniref:Protein FAM183A n=1 Tax=Ooceraea biroi TaxID=2015173 RepID=A0A026WE71_OOCBI|nr:uncharacterized protein LOC113561998 [Ooceraea biroi]EZA53329.1 hypothetical protein X777_06408 [Ooceraea biroi]RLU22841.1 hypothetical protein DMN91_005119 [Ooceraea biroi]
MATDLLTNPIKLRFYIERYEKENKLITLQKTFVPTTTRTKSLTGKFYARHDVISPSDVREDDVNLIKRQTEATPKDIYTFRPPAVNMEYGWFSVPLIPVTRDPRLCFSRKQSDFIANEIQLRKLQGLPEKKFTGVPFKT